jgi:hypothetical protein
MAKLSKIIFGVLLAIAIVWSLSYISKMSCSGKENYGGNQEGCEDQCFDSQYYDACMRTCMTGSTADINGRAEEYAIPLMEAGIPLEDDQANQGYVSTFAGPYRYETPGR